MKTDDEIKAVLDSLGNKPEREDWKGDNFKFGMLEGKRLALSWVLGYTEGGDFAIDHDYKDWDRESTIADEDMEDVLGDDDDDDDYEEDTRR